MYWLSNNSMVPLSYSRSTTHFPCPLCSQDSQRRFQKYEYWIRDCKTCHHRFAELHTAPEHVQETYTDTYFTGGGAGYPNYIAEATLLRQHGNRYAKLLSHYTTPGKVLDVGAAAGFILQGLLDAGWQGQGIEPNPSMAHYAQQTLNISVEVGTLEQCQPKDSFDVIMMIQAVAHFFDLQTAFAVASQHTKPSGFWLIETWNRESWMAKLLGKNWHEYSPPSVLHWFSPNSLAQFSTRYGFQEVARGRPTKQLSGAHAKSLLQYKLKDWPAGDWWVKAIATLPDHWTLPYPAEDLFWILLQKQ
jgi:2-polyprenyl-3-methyl-5-hydroxy-6-metoxy-1,4-benzoquinol methylase